MQIVSVQASNFLLLPFFLSLLFYFFEDKENGPRTVKDVKLISAGKILENNRTVGECQSPICDIPGGVTTMHVVVQQPTTEKGLIFLSETCQKLLKSPLNTKNKIKILLQSLVFFL